MAKNTTQPARPMPRQEEALKRLALLQEVRAEIDTALNLSEVLSKILDKGLRVVGVETGSIMLLNQKGKLEFKARRGGPDAPSVEQRHRDFEVGKGIAGWVAQRGEPALVPDVMQDERFVPPRASGKLLFRSLLSVPIMPADTAIGVINADHPDPDRFTETDLQLLSDLANQVLIAISRAGLVNASQALQQATTKHPSLPAFLEEVAHITSGLLYVPVCVIRLFDEHAQQLKMVATVRLNRTQAETIERLDWTRPPFESLKDERLIYIDDVRQATANLASSPAHQGAERGLASGMIAATRMKDEQPLGTIEIYTRTPRRFAPWEKDTFRVFAEQATMLIENMKLLEQEKDRVQALTSLYDVAQTLTHLTVESRGQLEDILQEIADQALNVSGADIVTLYQYYESSETFETPPSRSGRFNHPEWMVASIHPGDAPERIVMEGSPRYSDTARNDKIMRAGERVPAAEGLPERPSFIDREDVVSSAGIPLKVGEEVVGVMFVNYRTLQRFPDNLRKLLETFANNAAIAIQITRQFDALAQARLVEGREQAWKEFSATTAHRMGTEAADIAGALRWMKKALDPAAKTEDVTRYMTRIEAALRRINNAIRQFTEFAKPPELKIEHINVNNLLEEARSNVALEGVEKIRVHLDLADDLPVLRGDRDRLLYSFKEMFQNAIKAMPEGGDLRVVTRSIDRESHIRIEFVDTGPGIAQEHKEGIFEPGFRNRPGGTGLGLAIIRRTIQEHNGHIEEVGTLGKGAHFVIELPVDKEA